MTRHVYQCNAVLQYIWTVSCCCRQLSASAVTLPSIASQLWQATMQQQPFDLRYIYRHQKACCAYLVLQSLFVAHVQVTSLQAMFVQKWSLCLADLDNHTPSVMCYFTDSLPYHDMLTACLRCLICCQPCCICTVHAANSILLTLPSYRFAAGRN